MKGIETRKNIKPTLTQTTGSDHCPAMKGIETRKNPRKNIG